MSMSWTLAQGLEWSAISINKNWRYSKMLLWGQFLNVTNKMANDGNEGENFSKDDCTEESIESLRKEVERLKTRLEEERKKLNDISCKPELIANNNSLFSKWITESFLTTYFIINI